MAYSVKHYAGRPAHSSSRRAAAQLAWQLKDDAELTPVEALGLYERNWRHVDQSRLKTAERALIERLKNEQGNGVMLV